MKNTPPGRTLWFTDAAATAAFPVDWTEQQIRNALEQQVQLQGSSMCFGDPRLNAEFFARGIEGDDSAGFERSPEEASPVFVHGNGDDTPGSTSKGGTAGPGMKHNLVASYSAVPPYVYWAQRGDGGTEIWRRDMQSKSEPELAGGPFALAKGQYHHTDQTANQFRLWQLSGPPLELEL